MIPTYWQYEAAEQSRLRLQARVAELKYAESNQTSRIGGLVAATAQAEGELSRQSEILMALYDERDKLKARVEELEKENARLTRLVKAACTIKCPECGPHVKADEDFCCVMCGADCIEMEVR